MTKYQQQKPFLIALLLSLLVVHLPLVLLLMQGSLGALRDLKPIQKKPEPIFINLQPQAMPQRIVDISKPKNQKIPKRASAQSLYNSSVKQETTAAYSRQKGGPKAVASASQTTPQAQQPYTPPPIQTPSKTEPSQEVAKPSTDPLKPQTSFPPAQPKAGEKLSLKDQLKSLRSETKAVEQEKYAKTFNSQSMPMPQFKSNVGGSGEDYVPEYKVGNRTFVNTLANPNIGYFVELRRRFRTAFNPVPVLRPMYQRIADRTSVSVILGVSVDGNGRVADMVMIRSSGLPQYDQEARRTITTSAPFSKPPLHILDKDGKLNMAWTFTVYL